MIPFHRLLIATAVLFCAGFALWAGWSYRESGDGVTLATLLLLHGGDDPQMELLYFWAAVILALTPVLIFGGLGVWIARKIWRERREEAMRNAEFEMRN